MEETCNSAICRERSKHCAERLDDTRKLFLVQMGAMEKAVMEARRDLERRLNDMNEFRAQLEKQAITFVEKPYYDLQHNVLEKQIEVLVAESNVQKGRHSWNSILAIAAVMIALATAILDYAVHH
jgi:hypothetical protein